jgi:hypothetical protein
VAHPPAILAVTAPKNLYRQVLSRVQKYGGAYQNITNNTTSDIDGKSLLVALFECCMQVFTCQNIVVMAVDKTLSSKVCFICVEYDAGEPKLCNTAFEKPLIKLL